MQYDLRKFVGSQLLANDGAFKALVDRLCASSSREGRGQRQELASRLVGVLVDTPNSLLLTPVPRVNWEMPTVAPALEMVGLAPTRDRLKQQLRLARRGFHSGQCRSCTRRAATDSMPGW